MRIEPLDKQSEIPLYEQLYRFVKSEIENGNLIAEEKLPSKRRLAEYLDISEITVQNAYLQLISEGYLRSKEKSGYFVEQFTPQRPLSAKKEQTIVSTRPNKQTYEFDLKTGGVDLELFPFSIWKKLARKTLSEERSDLLNISDSRGLPELRRQIANYLLEFRGLSVSYEQVVLGAGLEYLMSVVIQLLGRSRVYGAEDPGYPKISNILTRNDCTVRYLPLDKNGMSLEALNSSDASVLHITPSHQYPTGIVMPIARRTELLHWANSDDRYIIEDDYDSDFRFSGQPIPALKGLDRSERVIYVNSFTKTLAPSLRISYMVLPPSLLEAYLSNHSSYSSTVPGFEQHTLCQFIEGGYFERHLSRTRKVYKEKRAALLNALKSSVLSEILTPIGNSSDPHLLLRITSGNSEAELIEKAKAEGVRVYGLSEYYSAGRASAEPTILLGYSGIKTTDIPEIFSRLTRAWI